MNTGNQISHGMEDLPLALLTPEELQQVQGGVRLVEVKVNTHSTGVVDWDELQWDIFTGRIGVTYK
jgi:hypothetical protein